MLWLSLWKLTMNRQPLLFLDHCRLYVRRTCFVTNSVISMGFFVFVLTLFFMLGLVVADDVVVLFSISIPFIYHGINGTLVVVVALVFMSGVSYCRRRPSLFHLGVFFFYAEQNLDKTHQNPSEECKEWKIVERYERMIGGEKRGGKLIFLRDKFLCGERGFIE